MAKESPLRTGKKKRQKSTLKKIIKKKTKDRSVKKNACKEKKKRGPLFFWRSEEEYNSWNRSLVTATLEEVSEDRTVFEGEDIVLTEVYLNIDYRKIQDNQETSIRLRLHSALGKLR